jgi:hypothetical protein
MRPSRFSRALVSFVSDGRLKRRSIGSSRLARRLLPRIVPYNYGLLKPRISGMPKNKAGDFVPDWNIFRSMRDFLEAK